MNSLPLFVGSASMIAVYLIVLLSIGKFLPSMLSGAVILFWIAMSIR